MYAIYSKSCRVRIGDSHESDAMSYDEAVAFAKGVQEVDERTRHVLVIAADVVVWPRVRLGEITQPLP